MHDRLNPFASLYLHWDSPMVPDSVRRVWSSVEDLPEPARTRWRCALALAWNEGARMVEVAYAADADFDLATPTWSRPTSGQSQRKGRFPIAPETRDAVSAAAAIDAGVGFVVRLQPSNALRAFRRIAERAGVMDLRFEGIRQIAMARDFQDHGMADAEFYARYPAARTRTSPRKMIYGETRHERGF